MPSVVSAARCAAVPVRSAATGVRAAFKEWSGAQGSLRSQRPQ
jgi:hypothetical protein